jgi:lysyl-tRNA synthetase class 2
MPYALSASLATLRQRAAMLAAVRAFFAQRSVLEVETPALSPAGVTDPTIASVVAAVHGLGPAPHYLQTSPELAISGCSPPAAATSTSSRVFRTTSSGGTARVRLEWYRVGWDEQQLMTEVAELVGAVLAAAGNATTVRSVHVRYADALHAALGAKPDAATPELTQRLAAQGVDVPRDLAHDAVLDLAFATRVVASFDRAALTFVHDYPVSQAALARLKPGPPPVAARFEVFSGGIELANGFHELKDAREQRRRFEAERARRRRDGLPTPPLDEDFLAALEAGLPDCAGVALGFDRPVALATSKADLKSALSFAHGKAD